MKLRIVAAILLITTNSFVFAAEPDALSYKGVRLGASMDEFRENLPDYLCTNTNCTYKKYTCDGAPVNASKEAMDLFSVRSNLCRTRTSFGGAMVNDGFALFQNRRFSKLILTIPSLHMEALLNSVEQRYGKPKSSNEISFINSMGVTFPNWQKTWVIGNDYLTLILRVGRVDEGSAVLTSGAQAKAEDEERANQTQKGSKDF